MFNLVTVIKLHIYIKLQNFYVTAIYFGHKFIQLLIYIKFLYNIAYLTTNSLNCIFIENCKICI